MPNRAAKKRIGRRAAVWLLALPVPLGFLALFFGTGRGVSLRETYLLAALLLLCAMGAFGLRFETRRPQARELVTLSVLAGLAVAGRVAFFMAPQIKPMLAVVILAGACLGPQSGFLVGSLSMLVSNFFFGQGPYTPWQMFACGLVGLLAGLLFCTLRVKKSLPALCVFGGLSVLFLYGGMMNLSTFLLTAPEFSPAAALMVFAAGVPFDAVHAGATVVFLLLFSRPMVQKLERLKKKYGVLERL